MTNVKISSTKNGKDPCSWSSTCFNGCVSDALLFFIDRETKSGQYEILWIKAEDVP